MRLIEVTSSRRTFKTVRFNHDGLSLIVGRHTSKQARNIKATYNGVGKSLLIAIIHYCLGSNSNKQFDAHLDGWDFSLTFEQDGRAYRVTRAVGDKLIDFDGTEMKLAAYRQTLNEIGIFTLPADQSAITFRALINFFIRPT